MQAEQLSFFSDLDESDVLTCPFLGRRVVVTGHFSTDRRTIRSTLLKLGASEVRYDKLQRSTHFLLVGDSPDQEVLDYYRLYVHDGYNVCRIGEEDLERICNGDYAPYRMPAEMVKELHLTEEHLYWSAPEIRGLKNLRQSSPLRIMDGNTVLYGREIFVHISLMDIYPELAQLIGCLGAYANTELADDADSILMPRDMPAEVCRAVEEYYNASRATQFNLPFILLEDLIDYIQQRVDTYSDEVMSELMNRFHCRDNHNGER
ncbi:MAG: hypothetical protein K2J00_00565 [Bacteroidaceae bacterium]|nr:hypothetical protein [Bacteroidaceae bacterium]